MLDNPEILDLLDTRELGVRSLNLAPDQADHLGRARQAGKIGVGNGLVLGEFRDVVLIDHDEAGQVMTPVTDHDRVRDIRAELQQVFDR